MKRITMGAVALVGVLAVAGCSASGSGRASSAGGGGFGTSADGAQGGKPGAPGLPPRATQPGAGGSVNGSAKSGAAAKTLLSTAALIRTAQLSVEIAHGSDVAAQANRAEQIALEAGGLVYSDERSAGTSPTAALTLKVPGAKLVSVLAQLAALGKETSRHSSTQDVTTEVADVTSRVRSAQASIDRLRLLFDRASRVGDVIALESELAQREADLESLQAQQRTFGEQTAMATLTLDLSTAAAGAHKKDHRTTGFLGGLSRGWHAFASGAAGLSTALGAALPFLVLLLLVLGGALIIRRRVRTGAGPIPADPA